LKTFTLSELKDKHIGLEGTPERDAYELELRLDLVGRMIKALRRERNLTQEQLGRLVGVQKAQISKIENQTHSATVDTLLKVFRALDAEVYVSVKLKDHIVEGV